MPTREPWDITDEEYQEHLATYVANDYAAPSPETPSSGGFMVPLSYLLFITQGIGTRYEKYAAWMKEDAQRKRPDDCAEFLAELEQWHTKMHAIPNRVQNTLECIDEAIASDPMHEKVTVLPLMCGYGKSTALKHLIRRTIKNLKEVTNEVDGTTSYQGDGLVIVTDLTERLEGYLEEELDQELGNFLKANEDKVTILTRDNIKETGKKQQFTPIVLMTSQRYFRLPPYVISNRYLRWKGGRRPLVIIDEKPLLSEVINISHTQLNDVSSALHDAVKPGLDGEKQWCIGYWERIRRQLHSLLDEQEALVEDDDSATFSYIGSGVDPASEEDDKRFLTFVKDHGEELVNFGMKRNAGTIPQIIDTTLNVLQQGAMYTCRKTEDYTGHFSRLVDNHSSVTEIDAKVIILDATGDVHPDYDAPYFEKIDSYNYSRRLDNLELRFVDYNASSNMLAENDPTGAHKKAVLAYLNKEGYNRETTPIFTFQKVLPYFRSRKYKLTGYLGNLKGSNEYRDAKSIVQVGVNRYDELTYLCFYMNHHPEVYDAIRALTTLDEQKAYLDDLEQQQDFISFVDRIILADLEQNMFRGAMRKYDYIDAARYDVICKRKDYMGLIEMAQERYGRRLGAHVELIDRPGVMNEELVMQRAPGTADGAANTQQRLIDRIREMPVGTEFTARAISDDIGANVKTVRNQLATSPVIKAMIDAIGQGTYKTYKKKVVPTQTV